MQAKRILKIVGAVALVALIARWWMRPANMRPLQMADERATTTNAGLVNQAAGSYNA